MNRCHLHPERNGRVNRFHRRIRNVMKFQIQENFGPARPDLSNERGSLRGEKL